VGLRPRAIEVLAALIGRIYPQHAGPSTEDGLTQPLMDQRHTATDPELEEIRRTALDYIEGWYDGNTERMERSLHPNLAKRIVVPNGNYWAPGDRLDEMSALSLIQRTQRGPKPVNERRTEVTVLDRFENAASVRVDAHAWVDYLRVIKWNGRWVIVNMLWELRPETKAQSA